MKWNFCCMYMYIENVSLQTNAKHIASLEHDLESAKSKLKKCEEELSDVKTIHKGVCLRNDELRNSLSKKVKVCCNILCVCGPWTGFSILFHKIGIYDAGLVQCHPEISFGLTP